MVGVVIVLLFVACTSDGSTDEATNSSTSLPTTSTTTTVPPSTTEPPDTTSTTKAPSGPGYGGVAIIADDQWPPTLNPWTEGGDNFIVSIIAQAWMTGAWDVDATTLEIVPEVVTEIPLTSNGGVVVKEDGTMTVAYSIRDEAVWDDGAPISGADFAFTLEQSLAYEANQEYYSDYTDADIVST
jgi:ABC-type transport system substrate-binding protein